LPPALRQPLINQGFTDPLQLAAAADLLHVALPPSSLAAIDVAAVSSVSHRSPSRRRGRSRRPSTPSSFSRRSESPRRRPTSPPAGSTLCWYHHFFQAKAKKCVTPCSWSGN
jgi:hypothetical protein